MPVVDLYSRRKAQAEGKKPDVYQYDTVSSQLRVQVRRILEDTLGRYWEPSAYFVGTPPPHNNRAWHQIRDAVAREIGRMSLANGGNPYQDCMDFILGEGDTDTWLDLVEFAFGYVDRAMRQLQKYEMERYGAKQAADDAIKELNTRFTQSAFGYRFESGQTIRVDSELIHAEVVRPALRLLWDENFKGAQDEFLAAHAHYRAGEYKDCAADALNALESTLKTICERKGWQAPKGARAADLIKTVRSNGLLPDYLDNSFDQLMATLQSGLPKVRNEEGGHGQGPAPRQTPAYVASYALHLAAAKIVLLVEAFRAGK